MFSWTKNWQRTKTEKYTKTHTTGRSWSITCPAKCYCDREIVVHSYQVKSEYYKVTTVSVSVLLLGEKVSTMQYRYHSLITLSFLVVPYTITAISPDSDKQCVEKGIMTAKLSSEAKIEGGDYKDEKKTALCG